MTNIKSSRVSCIAFAAILPALVFALDGCSSTGFSGNAAKAPTKQPTPSPTPTPSRAVVPVVPVTVSNPPLQVIPPAAPVVIAPPNAVTAGSFKVWADPANPAPMQDYQIHILIVLNSSTCSNYSIQDLTGNLVGTDGYRQIIGKDAVSNILDADQKFSSNGTTAELIANVPGARDHVQDDIAVQSICLNENQKVTLTFGN